MRLFLQRHVVKAGVGALAGLLSTELTRAAEPHLVELAINTVHATLHKAVTTVAGAQLAAAVARYQQRRRVFRIAGISGTISLGLLALFGWRAWPLSRAVPVAPAFQVSNPRIAALATQWGQLDVRAVGLVRTFAPPPQPADPRFAGFQQQIIALTQDGERIRLEYKALAPDGGSPSQLAEFLTLELGESVGLDSK